MSAHFIPRLASSKSWTDIPAELVSKITTVFNNQFKLQAAQGEFIAEGRIYPDEIVMRVGYLETGRLKQVNFEASMDLARSLAETADTGTNVASDADEVDTEESRTMERFYVCLDALGSVMEEYFQVGSEEDLDVPLRWRAFEFEADTVYLQQSSINSRLEAAADQFLAMADGMTLDKQLVQEERLSEDALKNAEIDSELAFAVQKAIRSGKFQSSSDGDPSEH